MNRYKSGRPSQASASTLCQKCLKKGHYSYECTAAQQDRPYVSRPSRTQQLSNPKLVPKLVEAAPEIKDSRQEGTNRGRDKKSKQSKRSPSVSSYSSSSDSVSTISTNRSRSRSMSVGAKRPASRDGASGRSRSREKPSAKRERVGKARSRSRSPFTSNERDRDRDRRSDERSGGTRRDRSREMSPYSMRVALTNTSTDR